jgi:hypothetical protein
MKTSKLFTTALVASLSFASVASAQVGVDALGGQWLGVNPNNSGVDFWNNLSNDGTNCNIGFFVKGGFGPCTDEHPGAFPASLNWTNAKYLAYNPIGTPPSRVIFSFNAGTYDISYLGNIAGANPVRQFGIREIGSGVTNWLTIGSTMQYNSTAGFEFMLQPFEPTGAPAFASRYDEQSRRQFAVFANGNDGFSANEFLVGSEDNSCTLPSPYPEGCAHVADYDFNDAMALVKVVPEPSTYALMAVGMAGLVGCSRRRRRVA